MSTERCERNSRNERCGYQQGWDALHLKVARARSASSRSRGGRGRSEINGAARVDAVLGTVVFVVAVVAAVVCLFMS